MQVLLIKKYMYPTFVLKVKVLDYYESKFKDRRDDTKEIVAKRVKVLTEGDQVLVIPVIGECTDLNRGSVGVVGRISISISPNRKPGYNQDHPVVKVVAFDEK